MGSRRGARETAQTGSTRKYAGPGDQGVGRAIAQERREGGALSWRARDARARAQGGGANREEMRMRPHVRDVPGANRARRRDAAGRKVTVFSRTGTRIAFAVRSGRDRGHPGARRIFRLPEYAEHAYPRGARGRNTRDRGAGRADCARSIGGSGRRAERGSRGAAADQSASDRRIESEDGQWGARVVTARGMYRDGRVGNHGPAVRHDDDGRAGAYLPRADGW